MERRFVTNFAYISWFRPPHSGFRDSRASISFSGSTTNKTEELGFGMHGVRYQPTTQAQELATERRFVTKFAYISWFHPLMQDLGTRETLFLSQVAQHYNTEELGFGMHGVRYQPTTQTQELATERRFVTNFEKILWFRTPHAGFRDSKASISFSSSTTNNREELGFGMHGVRY